MHHLAWTAFDFTRPRIATGFAPHLLTVCLTTDHLFFTYHLGFWGLLLSSPSCSHSCILLATGLARLDRKLTCTTTAYRMDERDAVH